MVVTIFSIIDGIHWISCALAGGGDGFLKDWRRLVYRIVQENLELVSRTVAYGAHGTVAYSSL